MWIEMNNLYAKLTSSTEDERRWLREYLSFDDARARFIKGKRDLMIRMFSELSSTFPAGFVGMVLKAAAREGFKVELLDKRVPVYSQPPGPVDLGWLRDYQREAVQAAMTKGRGIIKAPTGAGKTEIAAGLALSVPTRWLFLVHRTQLMEQAAERYEKRTGLRAGRIGEGCWSEEQFTCATFQTVFKRMEQDKMLRQEGAASELLRAVGGIMIDECHTLPADSFWRVAMATPNAYWRIGLSGTPLARGDRRSVLAIGALEKVIYEIPPGVLIEAGVLAKPTIRMVPVYQESDRPTWQGVYGECIVRSKTRNAALVEMVKQAEKPCLVFVKEVKHGKQLDAMLSKAGLQSSFVWGSHSVDWRKSAVKRLEQAGLDVLVCSVIFQEGVDIPSLRSVVIGAGGKSVIAALQRIGRGMRVEEGKTSFEVWDVADRGNRLLERHARGRMKAYQSEGYEVLETGSVVPSLAL